MNKIIIFSFIFLTHILMAQNFNYDQQWQEVEQLSKEGKVKSLLPKIESILSQAQKDNNTIEIVKALIYQSNIISTTQQDNEHDSYKLIINNLEKQIASGQGVTKSILQSQLAFVYFRYQTETQWRRQNITETETLSNDVSTWTTKQLLDKSFLLYKESIQNSSLLKTEKTENWRGLLSNEKEKEINIRLYPTLYDVLTYRYIIALSQNNLYARSDAETKETKETAKNLITDLILFHQYDTDKSAFLFNKLSEIQKNEENKDTPQPTVNKILNLAKEYPNQDFTAYLYYQAALTIQNTDKAQAYTICENVVYSKDNPWSINCSNLQKGIKRQSATINIDATLLANENIPLTITATNVDKIYYRIYEVNPGVYSSITSKNSTIQNTGVFSTVNKKEIQKGSVDLKHFDDFTSHSTIARLEGLPQGNYLIEISNNSNFYSPKTDTEYMLHSTYFMVNEWSVVHIGQNNFQLLNRKTGEILVNKNLQVVNERNSYTDKDPYVFTQPISVKTNTNGIFTLPAVKDHSYYRKYYLYNPESKSYIGLFDNYYYGRYSSYYDEDEAYNQVSFFTDRAIYRPGQKVYFKAVLYNTNKEKSNVVKNTKVKIVLTNPNGESVSTLDLISNEYGSIFGEFIVPQSGITGYHSLSSDFGSHGFSVEEYKRPKFEVTMDKLAGEYTLEKEVKTTGKAISFAGAPISEVKVIYRVEREEVFPFYHWWFPPQISQPETIIQGETITDDAGKFDILFTARAKEAKKEKEYRTYTYTVYADVTDINGETQTAQNSVTIGDLPKMLTLTLPEKATQKEFTAIGINSTNLNGVKESSEGKIIITKLEAPKRIVLPNKSNSVVDYQLYNEEEFIQYFPYLPYSKEEQSPDFWKKGETKVFDFDTQKSDTVKINSKFPRGYYRVEAYTLYGKDSIKTSKIINLLDDATLKSTDNAFFTSSTSKNTYKVGETIDINLISDLKNTTAILHLESKGNWIIHEEIPIVNGKATYSLPAKSEYLRNGLFVSSYLVKENGYAISNFPIQIIDKPKDLKITTKVFRDKITPGAKENWELTISGSDKDMITAEVLATMYDASLDQFASNSYSFSPWNYSPYGYLYYSTQFRGYNTQTVSLSPRYNSGVTIYPSLVNIKDFTVNNYRVGGYRNKNMERVGNIASTVDLAVSAEAENESVSESVELQAGKSDNIKQADAGSGSKQTVDLSGIQARTNLQETAFFYPNLYTDQNGDIKLSFTSPEALTKWKLLVLAHTEELESGTAEFYTQTQKELMVVPNAPRFLREGDKITLSTKINNLSGKSLAGNAQLFLFDALSGNPIDALFNNHSAVQPFNINADKNGEVNWTLQIPENIQAVTYRVVAQAGSFSDGEESILPVLTNRMLVTETLPLYIKENQTKEFSFDKLINNKSNSLQNFNLSMEMTTNPTWLAVLSLPYLREYPYECSEQLFSRLYGNMLSTYIIDSNPKIKKVFDNWNVAGINISNLEKNEELKNILLEETPWVRNAQNETEQKKRIALLFDLNKMSQENKQAQNKLFKRQNSDGGFAWFDGGKSSPYITETILLGFGQLQIMLGDKANEYLNRDIKNIIKKAIEYTDKEKVKNINERKKDKEKINGKEFMHYYYVRSFWKDKYSIPSDVTTYLADINKDIPNYFKEYDLQNKAMAAIVLNRYGYKTSAQTIVKNMKDTSVETDELGMYWKSNISGWYWYQTPVESQVKAIEAFAEVTPNDVEAVEEMKVWLLKNRQTNAWNSTKATTNAVYALMNFGKDWSNAEEGVKIWVGSTQFYPSQSPNAEQASGYIKQSWNTKEITPDMGKVKIEKTSPGVAWGGMYWQYFEDLDKITSADTNIKMQKQLYLKINTDKGQQLQEITNNKSIKVGDQVTIKLVIKVDQDMQYIHIKDMRASGFEPVNVLSNYKYQNGAGYYESTRDAATNFFFEYLRKGTYVFEYDVRANNKGEFSNGITQLQSMYAPEMSAHTEGIRIIIK